jgi:hypothetical protein
MRWKCLRKVREDETTNELFAFLRDGTEGDRRTDPRQGRARHSGDARGNRCLDVGTRIDNGNLTALLHAQGIARNDFVEG